MLPVKNRLKSAAEIREVLRRGRSVRGRFVSLKVMANNFVQNRFGFTVGTDVAKKAAERNRTKRHLRAIVIREMNMMRGTFDCVVVARPEIKNKNFYEIEIELKSLFKTIGLL